MKTGKIVGYITQPNGSPICNAEIWIAETTDWIERNCDDAAPKNSTKTDSRGYFQMPVSGDADLTAVSANFVISFGEQKGSSSNDNEEVSEKRFRVKGYVVREH